MSQIMGLPADDLLRDCKDRTVWEKGRYAGYHAAIMDVMGVIGNVENKVNIWETHKEIGYQVACSEIRVAVSSLQEDKG